MNTETPAPESQLVVVYDGECAMCDSAKCWLEDRDERSRLQFQPITGTSEVRGHHFDRGELEEQMHVVDADGRVYRGFAAWKRLSAEVPGLRPATPFLHALGGTALGDRLYRWIATHRVGISHRLGFDRRRARRTTRR
jgi:predicted DCC family thiol-disulfide oxidoreductase YuxK